jgi:hypothetical protein
MSTVSSEQQIIEIIEMLIPFKCNFTSSKGLKHKLENIDLKKLLRELKVKQPLTETVDANVTGKAEHRRRTWHPVLVSAGGDMRGPSPLDVSVIFKGLRHNTYMIVAWTEAWGQLADCNSPAAEAIRNYLDVCLDYHSRVLAEPAKYLDTGDEASWREFETRRVIKATLPPETIAEVDRRVRDLKERLGDSTTKRER